MAVAYDAATESVRTGTGDPHTFSHTGRSEGSGGVQGVVLAIIHGTSNTLHEVACDYGGVFLNPIVTAIDTSTETGRASLYFIGRGLTGLGGTQTITVDLASATTDDIQFVCITLTAGGNIDCISSLFQQEDLANPSVTLPYYSKTAISVGALYSGLAADTDFTVNGNCTKVFGEDLGNFAATVLRQTTPGTSDFAIGGTGASDDVAYVAAAFAEHTAAASGFADLVEFACSGEATNRTSFSVWVPGGVSGDRVVCGILHGSASDTGGSAPTDWVRIDSSFQGIAFYERQYTSTVASGLVTFTQGTSNWWDALVVKIIDSDPASAAQISTRGGATSTAPNSNSLTPSGGSFNWLWLSFEGHGHGFGTDATVTVWPTSYTPVPMSDPQGNLGQVAMSAAWRNLAASVEDPGAFTISGAGLAWITATIAVKPKPVPLAGSQPASTGAFSLIQYLISLAGAQPAGTGVVAALTSAAVAGNQPAGAGALALVQYLITLAGNQAAPSGTISVETSILVSLAGSQPAGSGSLASLYTQFVALAGNQPTATGAFSLIKYLVALSGNQPQPTGVVSALTYKLIQGNQPTPTGALAVLYKIALSGNQPAASGALALIKYLVTIAGNEPAATGALALEYFVSLAGNQPSASGALVYKYLVSLFGAQPGSSGGATVKYLVTLLGNQPAATGSLVHEFLRFVFGLARYAPTAAADQTRHAPTTTADQTRHAPVTDNALTRYSPTTTGDARHDPLTEAASEHAPTSTGETRYG